MIFGPSRVCLHTKSIDSLAIAVLQRRVTSLGSDTMSSLRFYYDLMSQPSRALFIIFRLSGMQFEDCPVALRNGRCDKEDYLIDNVELYYLVDDDFVLRTLSHATHLSHSLSLLQVNI